MPISMTWQMPVPLCTLPTPGINELTILAPILLTAYIDIYCGRNQKPVPPIHFTTTFRPSRMYTP